MSSWKDDGEYYIKRYATHESNPSKVIISIKKGTISVKEYTSTSHAKQGVKSGA